MPQAGTAPAVVEAPGPDAAEPAHERGPAHPGAGLWRVRSGEMLRGVLNRWGGRAGVEVLFRTDRRYRLHEGRTFAGSFGDAAEALFAALSHLPHPPVGEAGADGGTFMVMRRARIDRVHPVGDGQ